MSRQVAPSLGDSPPIQLFRILVTLGGHLRTRMDNRLSEIGLTTQQAAVITVVQHAGEPPTLGAIARIMGSSHQNVRQIVSVLERKGLVEVTIDPTDRRARRVHPSPAVDDLFGPRDLDDHAAVASWFSVLSGREQSQVVSRLVRVLDHLGAAEPEAEPEP